MNPRFDSYFYAAILISIVFYVLELLKPWRVNQSKFRKDFWLDLFYIFFNFFLFNLIIFNGFSDVVVNFFQNMLSSIGINNLVLIEIQSWHYIAQLIFYFVLRDFIQWNVHRLLHRVPRLWKYHQVHHSVKEMGFAAQMRYHWMESVVYRGIEYLPLAMIGFGLDDFFITHMIAFTIGTFNHANFTIPFGPLKYIFNNPEMHIWHHVKELPKSHPHGINFGISLSIWDYLFRQAHIPSNGRDIELGFPEDEKFPDGFINQSKII